MGLAQKDLSVLQRPQIIKGTLILGDFVIIFDPNTTTPILLETSTNLDQWAPFLNITTSQKRILFDDEQNSVLQYRFYRLRSPGISVGD